MEGARQRRWLLSPGERLNNTYAIDRPLGHGGMGEVYLGHSVALDEDVVAIKVILPEKARDENFRQLFGREARALLRIRHPHIVGYRSFSHDLELDLHYIVTDFVEGQHLGDRIRQGPFSRDEFATLARALAEGLAAVHEAGIIHRDLAPDNVILEEGAVARTKIIDFGVVKDTSGALSTIVGDNIVGKLNFMAPEQLGKPKYEVGPWTDVYSLGLVLLAALRGEAADMGGSFADAIDKRQSPVDLSDIDPVLAAFLGRLLTPHPTNRCQSMAEVLQLLERTEPEATVMAAPTPVEASAAEKQVLPSMLAAPSGQHSSAANEEVEAADAAQSTVSNPRRRYHLASAAGIAVMAAALSAETAGWTNLIPTSVGLGIGDSTNEVAAAEPASTVSSTDGFGPARGSRPNRAGSDGAGGRGQVFSLDEIGVEQSPSPSPSEGASPKPKTTPTIVARPSPTPSRSASCRRANFVIFFDWDRTDLTPQAVSILDQAIKSFGECNGQAQVYLAGHTDREGSAAYNVGKSQRMTETVRSYLTAYGVPGGSITSEAFGESRARITTADGVREPMNRRVEITIAP